MAETGIAEPQIILLSKTKRTPKRKKNSLKLEPWCCYIGSQPQSLQIYFKSKPINKIKSGQDKIRFDKIKSRWNKI